jgi:sterol desaturase/sphingolipid hydroxylase (fatty acid hydroxylase superfamily)
MEDIISILIPVMFVVMLVAERVRPARPLPPVKRWWLKGLLFFIALGVMNGVLSTVLAPYMAGWAVLHPARLGLVGGAVLGFVASDFLGYWIHRTMHNVPFIWRWTHQMHHSAERVDVLGSVIFHPFDIAINIVAPMTLTAVLGLGADAAALAGFCGVFCNSFQHLNVRTPTWLGYIIQRPEAHSVHHARGVHAYNYGNLGLWDLVFGTFRNPPSFVEQAGFWDGASSKIGAMLIGRDVGQA